MKLAKRDWGWIVVATICILFIIGLYSAHLFTSIENIFYDLKFKLRGPVKPSDTIVIIKIDELSLKELGRWPWDRKIIAKAVENLFNAGVRVVGLDILFPEKSNAISDKLLANALSKGKSVVSTYFENVCETTYVNGVLQKVINKILIKPIPIIERSSEIGYVNVEPDPDGVVRKITLNKVHNGIKYYTLNYKIAEIYAGRKLQNVPDEIFINYYGPSVFYDKDGHEISTFIGYSFVNIYRNIIPPSWLKDKIALIGSTAVGLFDHYPTPFINAYPGVEIHATVIENLLTRKYLRQLFSFEHNLILILILGILTSFLFYKTTPILTILLMLILNLSFFYLSYYLFSKFYLVTEYAVYAIEVLILGFSSISYKLLHEQKEKRIIKNVFSKYINPHVMEELLSNPESSLNALGGQKREITVVFTDIRDFTAISEIIPAEHVVKFLNEFFQLMNTIIFKYNGTIDKYIGDCIMFFWNAPIDQPDHAYLAVSCVIEMIKELEKLTISYLPDGFKLKIGAGINTGEAVIGNIGSSQLMQYTAVGDTVNTASRLQQLTKEFNTPIILSETVYSKINNRLPLIPLGKVKLRGKEQEIKIYTVEGMSY